MDPANPTSWLQLGATGALCLLVLLELRALRPVLAGVKEVLAALLERERIRDERRKRESSPPQMRPQEHPIVDVRGVPMGEFDEKRDTTSVTKLIELEREKERQKHRGYRPPRKGTTDGDD